MLLTCYCSCVLVECTSQLSVLKRDNNKKKSCGQSIIDKVITALIGSKRKAKKSVIICNSYQSFKMSLSIICFKLKQFNVSLLNKWTF